MRSSLSQIAHARALVITTELEKMTKRVKKELPLLERTLKAIEREQAKGKSRLPRRALELLGLWWLC